MTGTVEFPIRFPAASSTWTCTASPDGRKGWLVIFVFT